MSDLGKQPGDNLKSSQICLLRSGEKRKRPVIGREPSGPFSTDREDRRILAVQSGLAPQRLCSRDGIREIVGHHLEVTATLTRERGQESCLQLNSGNAGFGSTPSFFQNGLLRKPLVVPPTPSGPPKGGTDGRNYLVTLIDHSPRPLNLSGNSPVPRAKRSACLKSGGPR